MTFMRSIFGINVRAYLLREGRENMAQYTRAVSQISNPGEFDTRLAETLAPSIKRYRRRGKACARMLRRLQKPTPKGNPSE